MSRYEFVFGYHKYLFRIAIYNEQVELNSKSIKLNDKLDNM